MNPGERAHRRWPVPTDVAETLLPGKKMSEYGQARVYDYFATLYSVIDAQQELLTEQQENVSQSTLSDVLVMQKRLAKRLDLVEKTLPHL